jgi:hypothetical protein
MSQNTSAGIDTSLRAGQLRNRILISGRGKELVSLEPTGDQWVQRALTRVKAADT